MSLTGESPFDWPTHTDHVGENARRLASAQILQTLSYQQAIRPMPTVLTGDMNALPSAPKIEMISNNSDIPFTDATAELAGTFHNYDRLASPQKIDYIFTNHHFIL